jgi:hypothetical protein
MRVHTSYSSSRLETNGSAHSRGDAIVDEQMGERDRAAEVDHRSARSCAYKASSRSSIDVRMARDSSIRRIIYQVRSEPAPQKLLFFLKINSGMGFALESRHGRLWSRDSVRRPATTRRRAPIHDGTVRTSACSVAEDPTVAGYEILRRLRLSGYRGGKSALYELARRLRVSGSATVGAAGSGPTGKPNVIDLL